MEDIRVSSWNEVNDCLYADSWREPLGRFRSNNVFRGLSRAARGRGRHNPTLNACPTHPSPAA